tara:strand:+ start:336 stop:596 length:261 start_codon:yes stop_codon:yes gene_type:complete
MSWQEIIKEPKLHRVTNLFGEGKDDVQEVEKAVRHFLYIFSGNNPEAAFRDYDFSAEEIKAVKEEYKKVRQARIKFKDYLMTLDWK